MAQLLDGKKTSQNIRDDLKRRVEALKSQHDFTPTLATILVGNDPASDTYVNMKTKACATIGMDSKQIRLSQDTTTQELLGIIDECNGNDKICGILLQHPSPPQIDERLAFDRILPQKDVDGVTTLGFGKISFEIAGAYPSCTPAGIMALMEAYKISIEGKHAVVVGRSAILGRPVAELLLNKNATVTVCHSRTKDLTSHVKQADILVAACGKPEFIKGEWIKEGAVVIDAGYNKGNVGDVEFTESEKKASWITPVPGGVGPMTITMLLAHTVMSAELHVA